MRTSIRMRRLGGLAMGVAMAFQGAWAQKNPAPGGGTHPPPSVTPNMTGRADGPAAGSLNGNIYLTGNVLLDDGNPPPDPVTIERVCNGSPRAQGYTDHKGRFSFQIGQAAGVMQDASEEGTSLPATTRAATGMATGVGQQPQLPNMPDMLLANCDLRAVLGGFRSDTIALGARRLMDDPHVGTIVLHRLANVEGSAVSMTSLQAPKDARRAYERALQSIRKNKPADAGKALRTAVEIYPNYAAAWYELGQLQAQEQDIAQARKSFANALAADARFISPYLKLVELAARVENWTELADTASRLLKLDPVDYPMAYFYHATASLNLGQLDAAEKSARAGEKLDTPHRYPRMEQLLATVLARKKDYAGAAAHLRTYLLLAPDAEDAARVKKELAELERLSGANSQAQAAPAQN